MKVRDVSNNMQVAFVAACLRGTAAIWFYNLPNDKRATYELFKTEFENKFDPKTADNKWVLEYELEERRQRPTETVDTFAATIQSMCFKLGKDADATLATFIRNLRANIKLKVIERSPKSLEDAIMYAKLAESVSRMTLNDINDPEPEVIAADTKDEKAEIREIRMELRRGVYNNSYVPGRGEGFNHSYVPARGQGQGRINSVQTDSSQMTQYGPLNPFASEFVPKNYQ